MKSNLLSSFEEARLHELATLDLLDTPAEKEFEDIVELAARVCGVPISLVSLVAEDRQWFKARTGLDVPQTSRSVSFCAHALQQNDIFLVKDAAADERFAENPLVTGDPRIRFYAGAPLVSPKGYKLGTLCIIDNKPRELNWEQAVILKTLANQVSKLIELRQKDRLVHQLQTEANRKNEAIEKLKSEKQRKAALSQLFIESVAAFLQEDMQVLKTGKFTKKELSGLFYKAGSFASGAKNFGTALAVLTQLQRGENLYAAEAVPLRQLLSGIEDELAGELKDAFVKLTLLMPEGLLLHQYRQALYIVVKTLLQILLRRLRKTEIIFVANELHGEVQMRFEIMSKDLSGELTGSLPQSGTGRYSSHLELALVKDIVAELSGGLSISRLGNDGTTVSLQLQALKAMEKPALVY